MAALYFLQLIIRVVQNQQPRACFEVIWHFCTSGPGIAS